MAVSATPARTTTTHGSRRRTWTSRPRSRGCSGLPILAAPENIRQPSRMSVLARLRDDPLLQTLLHTGKRDVPVTVALRNTAAIVLPLLVGALTGHLFAGLGISVGA